MRAIMVAVDYDDLLNVTLPYNRHHFDEVCVVTSPDGFNSVEPIATLSHAQVVVTDLFYRDGATFNKWRALEYALDVYGRHGWMCIMDADVLWPERLPDDWEPVVGNLYTPFRRMFTDTSQPIPQEDRWSEFPRHRQEREFAGYSQVFHATDPVLGNPPWHQIDWRHAGGADSFFQAKWSPERKIRPSWEVLHIGEAGMNWCGRATPRLDGTRPDGAQQRINQVRGYIAGRRGSGERRFSGERIPDLSEIPSPSGS